MGDRKPPFVNEFLQFLGPRARRPHPCIPSLHAECPAAPPPRANAPAPPARPDRCAPRFARTLAQSAPRAHGTRIFKAKDPRGLMTFRNSARSSRLEPAV